jgi:cyclic lactone autoinducer peptide
MMKKLLVPFASAFALVLTVVSAANMNAFKLFLLYEPDSPEK